MMKPTMSNQVFTEDDVSVSNTFVLTSTINDQIDGRILDINKAPSNVHSILVPLLEGASSIATGHGE
ncbi:hypothetical protein CR513_16057, partial [Mucuna pruriens]